MIKYIYVRLPYKQIAQHSSHHKTIEMIVMTFLRLLIYILLIFVLLDLYNYTKTNAELVNIEPKDIPAIQKLIILFDQLKSEVTIRESEFPSIKSHFETLDKFEVTISSTMRTMENNMDGQWKWYIGRLRDAEEMIESSKDQFKLSLFGSTDELKTHAKKLLDTFMETAPISSDL